MEHSITSNCEVSMDKTPIKYYAKFYVGKQQVSYADFMHHLFGGKNA